MVALDTKYHALKGLGYLKPAYLSPWQAFDTEGSSWGVGEGN